MPTFLTGTAAEEGQLGCIEPSHRPDVVPLLVRILYGRFVSKSRGSKAAREQNLARRAAILSFLSRLLPKETVHLVHLMLRGVVPPHRLLQLAQTSDAHTMGLTNTHRNHQQVPTTITDRTSAWYTEVHQCATELTVSDVQELSWERQVGFLHLFEQTIKLIGFGATAHVGVLLRVVLTMLRGSQSSLWRKSTNEASVVDIDDELEALDADDEDDDDIHERGANDDVAASGEESENVVNEKRGAHLRHANQASKVRNLALLRLSEAVHQYHGTFDFSSLRHELLEPLRPLIAALPGAVVSSSKPPALLKFIHAVVYYPVTAGMVVPILHGPTTTAIVPQNKTKQKKTSAATTAASTGALAQSLPLISSNSSGSSGGDDKDEYGQFIVRTLILCVASRTNQDVSQMVYAASIVLPSNTL